MESIDWTNTDIIKLISLYKERPMLWDRSHPSYRIPTHKYEAWEALAGQFGVSLTHIKMKINSLLASYRRERTKMLSRKEEGYDFVSTWFAYSSMTFLNQKYKPLKRKYEAYWKAADKKDEEGNHSDDSRQGYCFDMEQRSIVNDHSASIIGEHLLYDPSICKQEPDNGEGRGDGDEETPLEAYSLAEVIGGDGGSSPKRKRKMTELSAQWMGGGGDRGPRREEDECEAFGSYIGHKLRKLGDRARHVAQRNIGNILFEAAMGKYDKEEDGD